MKPITSEWVEKAEADFAILERELRARKNPSFDGACFHAQQCAEKYLKARLCEEDVNVPRIHDLVALLEMVLPFEPLWETYRVGLAYLSDFAIVYRYPGESADRECALEARRLCRSFRSAARNALGVS